MRSPERIYRLHLRAYPPEFRARFERDLVELFADLHAARAAGRPLSARTAFWLRIALDTIRHGAAARREARHLRRYPLSGTPARGVDRVSQYLEDLRHAVRALRAHRAVTAVVVLTLALAIGANTAIFTVVNAVLLEPLPFDTPDRVVVLYEVAPDGRDHLVSIPAFEDLRRTLRSIVGLSVFGSQTANLTGVAEPDRLRAGFVTAEFFPMLGVQPIIGRGFADGEDRPGAPRRAVLTYRTWQNRFAGDPAIIGRALILNNDPHEVIGILPPKFEFPLDALDVWMPLSSYPSLETKNRGNRSYFVVGRVTDQVSFEQADQELKTTAAGLAAAYPESSAKWTARFEPFHEVTVEFVGSNLRLLAGAVGFVLLIACANIANLLLARASGRQREMALRVALGSSRGRLVRQLLVESVVMATAGGAIGLVFSAALTDAMLTLVPNLPRADQVAPDGRVIAFTALLSIATGVLFGIVPALRTSRTDLRLSLNESPRTGESRSTGRLRGVLVVAELALALVLLVGAAQLIQSLYRTLSVDLGYDPERLLTLEYRLPRNKYTTSEQQAAFHHRVVEAIARVPGVTGAALARAVPQSGNGGFVTYWKAEETQPHPDAMTRAQYNTVTPDYFRVMKIPVLAGRVCGDADLPDAPLTVIVNRHLAERLWPGESPLGRQLRSTDIPVTAVVAGVVGDTRPQLLSMPITSQIYGCYSQQPGLFASVIARTAGEPMAVARSVQHAIWSIDRDQPVWKIRSSETIITGSVQTQRFVMLLMTAAAGLALLLAAVGTYSVLSYTVERRSREVGVRMALGATRSDVARLVLSHTAVLTMAGIALGVGAAVALTRLLSTQLPVAADSDPMMLVWTSALLATVSLVAAWLPARRATSVDPMVTLRAE